MEVVARAAVKAVKGREDVQEAVRGLAVLLAGMEVWRVAVPVNLAANEAERRVADDVVEVGMVAAHSLLSGLVAAAAAA